MEKRIEMKNITKVFPGTIANDNINLNINKGETHALLGENGAGKTTLMNILYGLYQPDRGEIYISGKKEKISSPRYAIKSGINMVHQHFMLVPNLTVVENIILGKEPKKISSLDTQKALRDVVEISEKYGFNIKCNAFVEDLSVGQQQKVEILKALYREAQILILDEPTAVLTPQEIDELGLIIDNLKKEGKSIILITHKLKEIMRISDRITVLRRGKVTGVFNKNETNMKELVECMVGEKMNLVVNKSMSSHGDNILKVENLIVNDNRGLKIVDSLNLDVRAGEIVGLAGVDGNGQSELIEALTGLRKIESGRVLFKNEEIQGCTPKEITEKGIASIPEDRQKRGLILKFSLIENSIIGSHSKKPYAKGILMNYKKIREHCNKLIKEFDVRTPGEEAEAVLLSGGNQQKFIVAREMAKEHELLIASQPTRGIDAGATNFIHKRLLEERDKGKAVLLISSELDEIMELSDRIAVIYKGMILSILPREETDEREIGVLMAGGNSNQPVEGVIELA